MLVVEILYVMVLPIGQVLPAMDDVSFLGVLVRASVKSTSIVAPSGSSCGIIIKV